MAFTRAEVMLGYGKRIGYCATLGGTYITVFGTINIQLPQRELAAAEITNDDSPDFHKDYIAGMYESGNISFTYRYTRTQFTLLETLFQLATLQVNRNVTPTAPYIQFWKITLPDGSVANVQGFITKHDLPVELEEAPVVEVEVKCLGKMTFTAGTGASLSGALAPGSPARTGPRTGAAESPDSGGDTVDEDAGFGDSADGGEPVAAEHSPARGRSRRKGTS